MTALTLVLPDTPVVAMGRNGRGWARQMKAVEAAKRAIAGALLEHKGALRALVDTATDLGFDSVAIEWHVYWEPRRKRWDDDNLISALKAYRDELAAVMGIDDASFETRAVTQHFDQSAQGETVVILTLP